MQAFDAVHDSKHESQMRATLESPRQPRILVLGDLMLDRYTRGDAERISPEAPVLVLQAERTEERLGGAGLVAFFLAGLGAAVECAGVVGDDFAGHAIRRLLDRLGNVCGQWIPSVEGRQTTTKERFIGKASGRHAHQILRVDREVREPIGRDIEERLLHDVLAHIARFDLVLLSDYGKGVCTPSLCQQLIATAKNCGVPVLVDPARTSDYSRYYSATLITPNRTEAELASGRRIHSPRDAISVGEQLCEQLNLAHCLVTLDRDGIAAAHAGGAGEVYPTRARDVYDITGAGDMVLAAVGFAIGNGASVDTAVRLANLAAGLEVEHMGAKAVSRRELCSLLSGGCDPISQKMVPLEEIAVIAEQCRQRGQRIVLTNGCFDLLHIGHVRCLQEASRLGDVLVVALNSDSSVRRLKGKERPILSEKERCSMLAALEYVDYVVVFSEDTPHTLISRIRPDVLVKGGTYLAEEVIGRDLVEAYGGRVTVTTEVEGMSTTRLLNRLQAGALSPVPNATAPTIDRDA